MTHSENLESLLIKSTDLLAQATAIEVEQEVINTGFKDISKRAKNARLRKENGENVDSIISAIGVDLEHLEFRHAKLNLERNIVQSDLKSIDVSSLLNPKMGILSRVFTD